MTSLCAIVLRRAKDAADGWRKHGWWSYSVPGLEWAVLPVERGQEVSLSWLEEQADFIVIEDWAWPNLVGQTEKPLLYVVVDSNTSTRRLAVYQQYAAHIRARVILVDQDELKNFCQIGPSYRWAYAVNEMVFHPLDKTVDVAYHCARTPERSALGDYLACWMKDRPYIYTTGCNFSIAVYAALLGRAKICVHLGTHPQCRSHRLFDALASGCCLLTSPLPYIDGDGLCPGVHYEVFHSPGELTDKIAVLLSTGHWQEIAERGREYVLAHHTWTTRAEELKAILAKEKLCGL